MITLTFGWMVVYMQTNKSVWTLIFGQFVVHRREIKWKRTIYFCQMVVQLASAEIPEAKGSISPSSFYGQLPDY